MATLNIPIVSNTGNTVPVPSDTSRRMLYIKNYVYAPGTTNAQTEPIYVAFGVPATLGTNGELELIPGGEYTFGGPLPARVANLPKGFLLPTCPTESINVISASGPVYGAVMTQ